MASSGQKKSQSDKINEVTALNLKLAQKAKELKKDEEWSEDQALRMSGLATRFSNALQKIY